ASSPDRKPGPKPVATACAGPGLELTTVDRNPLAHADEAVSTLVAVSSAAAVVAHRQLDLPVAVADEHLGVLRARVLERVRESFLDEPVGGEVDAGRKLLRIALDPQVDGEPGLARVLDELVEVGEARLRSKRGRLLGAPQHADHPPHLRERLASRLLADEQRLPFLPLVDPQEAPRPRRLHGHDADAVSDAVVHLA